MNPFNYIRIRGAQKKLQRSGVVKYHSEKQASVHLSSAIKIAQQGMPTPQEVEAVGMNINEQDLMSLEKVLSVLFQLYQEYQMQMTGGMQQGGMPPQGMPPQAQPPMQQPPMGMPPQGAGGMY